MNTSNLQKHPFEPFCDEYSKVLILGSFPSPDSKKAGFTTKIRGILMRDTILEVIVEKFNSKDGLVCYLLQYLQNKTLVFQHSKLNYFNQLSKSDDKAQILSLELNQWYQHHKSAHWYNSHNSKHNTYCGYWCFEIAALSKILEIDDESFASCQYYPYDLAHW